MTSPKVRARIVAVPVSANPSQANAEQLASLPLTAVFPAPWTSDEPIPLPRIRAEHRRFNVRQSAVARRRSDAMYFWTVANYTQSERHIQRLYQ
ncbi:hypothetical protein BCV69DRAFT_85506 [Microstroma glucosiphilum]|uniref:Uncharacterized protein n=1 Tax=Pseudomicrostroma glucosiphilum TaxID=1684307 RepID=A0A316TZP9_9BASI|nr:hypothetical protein BCV69DRAFT_85506 [Pseudomicrostroma glucosiphilum]PWN18118.1 hypothetical protein BCV69DRAFT_85506 [Pseudomicrostroma glucosiphilum]